MKYYSFLVAVSLPLFLCACLKNDGEHEAVPSISIDRTAITTGADPTADTIYIASNRAWSLILDPSCDWLSVDKTEHINLLGASDRTPLILSVADNPVKEARSTSFRIVGEGISQTVQVDQAAIVYRLSVTSPHEVTGIDDRGTTVRIAIETNDTWTATVLDGATAEVSLLKESGYRSEMLEVLVAPNLDKETRKSATVRIEVAECDPVEVVLDQKAMVPFVSCSVPEKDRLVDPNVFSSIGGTRWFDVESNAAWQASVNTELTTASGVSLPVESGSGNMESFKVVVSEANLDFDHEKRIVIDFQPEEGELFRYEMVQQKGSIIDFEFRDQDHKTKNWPFVMPEANPGESNKGEGWFYTPGGYCLHCYASGALYLNLNGFQCGNAITDYIELPAVPERALVRVTLIDYNGSTLPDIRDAQGNVVKGGEYSTDFTYYVPMIWNLYGTEKGKAYRIVTNKAKYLRMQHLELEYR